MSSGTGKAPWLTLLAAALAVALSLPAAAAATPGTTTSLTSVPEGGARVAAALDIFTVDGAPKPNRINAFTDAGGRLILVSPEGITAPSSPAGVCTQDSPTQVSCSPGFVDVIAGDLGGGPDVFTASSSLTVSIGVNLAGEDRPLLGGGGRDRLIGGAGEDLILGGGGADTLKGGGGTDLLRGGGGADNLSGGSAPDALYGGGGPDRLNGGGGRDRCVGGPDVDVGKSCTESRAIP